MFEENPLDFFISNRMIWFNISEWNEWREANEETPILLEDADFMNANLEGANLKKTNLEGANLRKTNLEGADLYKTNLEGADLYKANLKDAKPSMANMKGVSFIGTNIEGALFQLSNLEGADLLRRNLKGAEFAGTNLKDARLQDANLEGVSFMGANLKNSSLISANLKDTDFFQANLDSADLEWANLEGADLKRAKLEGAKLWKANLEKTCLEAASVNGTTFIWDCWIDEDTDFTGVGLDSARIEPKLKERLKFNIRRRQWRKWYGDKKFKRWPMNLFWKLSDYGGKTDRILEWFALFAAVFALTYYFYGVYGIIWKGSWENPGIIDQLFIMENNSFDFLNSYIRAIYFSVGACKRNKKVQILLYPNEDFTSLPRTIFYVK